MRSENDSNSLLSYRWSQGESRKRKINSDQKFDRKRFLSEEKMIKGLQALSLDLSFSTLNDEKEEEDEDEDDEDQPCLQLHHILEDTLKRDPFQDGFIDRLYGLECKKLSMQIVPYMPVYPGQLQSTTVNSVNTSDNRMEEETEKDNETVLSVPVPPTPPVQNDDHLFKRPLTPPAYTVEEPCDTPFERSQRMKRSYSQSLRSNSNLTVVELKTDENDHSCVGSQDDYIIVEPCTPILFDSLDKNSSLNTSTTYPSVKITEYFDFFPSTHSNRERLARMDIPLETSETMEAEIDL